MPCPRAVKLGGQWRVRCTVCRYWLPARSFYGDRTRDTGTSTRCKSCQRKRAGRKAS
jgi:hypothetical protein